MYHRPVALTTPTMHGNSMAPLRSRSTLPHNENAFRSSKNVGPGSAKQTPKPTGTRSRQAFGDISNRKASNDNGGGSNRKGGSSDHGPLKNSVVLKQKPTSSKMPFAPSDSNRGLGYQSRIPKLGKQPTSGKPSTGSKHNEDKGSSLSEGQKRLSKRSHPWSQKQAENNYVGRSKVPGLKSSGFQPRQNAQIHKAPSPGNLIAPPSSSYSRKVDFPVPMRPAPEESKSRSHVALPTATSSKKSMEETEPIDDVELPAGRTWDQQLDIELRDDDDYSTSSMGETLDRRTMWDDWRDSMQRQWDRNKAEELRRSDRMIQEQIEEMLKRDMEEGVGIESLIDIVDDLDLSQKKLDDSLNLDILLEDDDWSAPASSLDGILDEDLGI